MRHSNYYNLDKKTNILISIEFDIYAMETIYYIWLKLGFCEDGTSLNQYF
jgi:hypothetical protein